MQTEKKRYGWLSPDGSFRESEWGTHTTDAFAIIREKLWDQEFAACRYMNARDFLCLKGYCLLHDPSRHNIQASHTKPLTKRQRQFLCDFFLSLGDSKKAYHYMEEEF